MQVARVLYLYEGRTNSSFRDPFLTVPEKFHRLGVECLALDLRHVPWDEIGQIRRSFCGDFVFQITRRPRTAVQVARVRSSFGVPLVLWNLEEPNSASETDTLSLAESVDRYYTLDPRMLRHHRGPAGYLPPCFDEDVYRPRFLSRDISVAYLGQYSTPGLRAVLRPLVEVVENCDQSFVSVYRPMMQWGGPGYRAIAGLLDVAPLAISSRVALAARRMGVWPQDAAIRPHGYFANGDEEEKAFIYGRSRIGIGFTRLFGAWEQALRRYLPDYEWDEHGRCVQLKSRHFEIAGAGAMLLSDQAPELDALFEPGSEYVAYDYTQPDDLREKIHFYLSHDSERERIARAGEARARREHTLSHRLATVLQYVRNRW